MDATVTREIPLGRLKPSPANARKTNTESGIEELAASIAAHGLLQMPVVTPELDKDGQETERYLVVAGERRRKALRLLVKQKRLRKDTPVTCLVRTGGDGAELSLAENVVRVPMHPADQFEAFARLHEEGRGVEEIAGRFGITTAVVRQRLRLAAVSPTLMALYRRGELTLDQLMAFAVTDDHARQEQAWQDLSWNKSPEVVRRLLTSGQVRMRDRRVAFVGLEAYEAAGGPVVRDLFLEDEGGWLSDSELLDRLVREKLETAADEVRLEGWKWVEAHLEYPYSQANRLHRIRPQPVPLSDADQARLEALTARYEALASEHDAAEELPQEVTDELDRLETETTAIRNRSWAHLPEEVARAGAIVALSQEGALRIERGFVRAEDEPRKEEAAGDGEAVADGPSDGAGEAGSQSLRPLPDALVVELTAQRTAALQECLAASPEMALIAVIHALALRVFGWATHDLATCLGVEAKVTSLPIVAPGIEGSRAGEAMAQRHEAWARRLPEPDGLWDWLLAQASEVRLELLAHCAARTVDAVQRSWEGRGRKLHHADQLARALDLDMAQWWEATRESYLARIPKARILEAVREAASERDAESLTGLKKEAMVEQAERLLAGKGWLPTLLRSAPTAEAEARAAAE